MLVVLRGSISAAKRDRHTPSVHFRLAVLDTLLAGEEGEIVLARCASTVTPRSAGPGLFGGMGLGLHGDAGQRRVANVTSGSRRSNERATVGAFFKPDVLETGVARWRLGIGGMASYRLCC